MSDAVEQNLVDLRAPWRVAVNAFIKEGFQPGEPITHAWFHEQLGLTMSGPGTPLKEAQATQFAYLAGMDKIRDALLSEYQIALRSVRGVGYEVVPPYEQTQWAEDAASAEMKKILGTARDRLTNVNAAKLTADQRLENANALARLSMMAGLHCQISKGELNPLANLPKASEKD